jgi:spermidine/putrescine transport system permease protein
MKPRRLFLGLLVVVLFVFLYSPIVVVVVYSFNAAKVGGPWAGFTTEWYTRLFNDPEKFSAATHTLLLAGISTSISTLLGTLLGYGLSRYSFPGKGLFSWLMYFPMVVPDIVAAGALLLFYWFMNQWLGIFQLGLTTMVIAHVTFQIPFIAIVVRSRMSGMDPLIEEAAHDLGANQWQTFWQVTLPMILPGVLAGAALAFTLSIDDFVISYFTAGPGLTTLPILIYASVKKGIKPEIHALSTLIVFVSIICTVMICLINQRGRHND